MLLRQIQRKHKTHIIIIGHADKRKFQDPYLNEAYDRYQIKLHHKAADIVKESVDMILFMRKEVAIKKEGKGSNVKIKAFNVEERVIHTQLEPAFDAGSRMPLPASFEVPENGGFQKLLQLVNDAKEFSAEDLFKQCFEAIKRVQDEDTRLLMHEHISKNKENAGQLRAALDRILAKTKEH